MGDGDVGDTDDDGDGYKWAVFCMGMIAFLL